MEEKILDNIASPKDLKALSLEELYRLSDEIREKIVATVSDNGGHLASNLGVVELTIALHSIFNTPEDKIVWDVGHQSYAHKILTGRCDRINTIRREGGLSGFPKRLESKYDAFDTGHSSTSVSAAYGLSCAADLCGEKRYVIAVIGDGALTGGLALEAINSAGRSKQNLIVILNDNKMSISKNVGSMARYLTKIRMGPFYLDAKSKVHKRLDRIPGLGKPISRFVSRLKNWIRLNFFGHQKNMFEQLGFNYYGPLDGHDISQLRTAMKAAKRSKGPVMLHVRTVKGKGYEFAEKDPKIYHGISAFDIETGEAKSSSKGFSDVFGAFLCKCAATDKRIVAITAAMAMGTGLSDFSKKYKNRFFDVGIAEEHAVTFAAGLAAGNIVPVFAVYSTFLQRSYDQILHDAALQHLHIVLAIDRTGIVGEDGETHQGIFDVAFLNTIPNVTIYSPAAFDELESMMYDAIYKTSDVVAVRYPRGGQLYIPEGYKYSGEPYSLTGNKEADILIITYGRLFSFAALAARELRRNNIDVCILKLNRIKPIDPGSVTAANAFSHCYFFEEGMRVGGIGESFGLELYQQGYTGKFDLIAIENYVPQAKVDSALKKTGLDDSSMVHRIMEDYKQE